MLLRACGNLEVFRGPDTLLDAGADADGDSARGAGVEWFGVDAPKADLRGLLKRHILQPVEACGFFRRNKGTPYHLQVAMFRCIMHPFCFVEVECGVSLES